MNLLKNKTVGFYIQAIVPVFCLISLITYLVYASALGKYDVKILLGLGLGCVLGALQLFLQIGVFELLSSVLISVTLFYFITLTETIRLPEQYCGIWTFRTDRSDQCDDHYYVGYSGACYCGLFRQWTERTSR